VRPCALAISAGLVIAALRAQAPDIDTARAYDARGVELAQAGKTAEALRQFRDALRAAPSFPDAHYHLALAHSGMGHTDEALAELEEALRLRPDFLQARYQLAGCCRKRGDFEGEARLLAEITQQAPDFAEAQYNFGLSLQRSDKPAEAVEQLHSAVRLEPRNPRFALALGVALADRDSAEASAILRRVTALTPSDPEAHFNLALTLAAEGREDTAIGEFQAAISLNSNHAGARRGLGIALMHADRLKESAEQLQRAAAIAPRDAETANNLGIVLLRLKDTEGAVATLEKAIAMSPKLIKAHVNLAQAYLRVGRADDARRASARAEALTKEQRDVGRAMVLVQAAQQHLRASDAAAAIPLLREAIEAHPGFVEAHMELGRAVLESGVDPAAAIRHFRTALNLDPERADAHYQIGLAMRKMGDNARALEELKSAVTMAPCRVEMMRALAAAALDAGDRATGLDELRRVLAWDPQDQKTRATLERVLRAP
jgi:tetratricopeptide (TPR) repeat protein